MSDHRESLVNPSATDATADASQPPVAKRRRRRALTITLAVVALLAVAIAALVGYALSERGLPYIVARIVAQSAGRITVDDPTGSVAGTMRFRRITWHGADATVMADDVVVDWNPGALWSRRLSIRGLGARHVDIAMKPSTGPTAPPTDLRLPLAVDIERLAIAELDVARRPARRTDIRTRVRLCRRRAYHTGSGSCGSCPTSASSKAICRWVRRSRWRLPGPRRSPATVCWPARRRRRRSPEPLRRSASPATGTLRDADPVAAGDRDAVRRSAVRVGDRRLDRCRRDEVRSAHCRIRVRASISTPAARRRHRRIARARQRRRRTHRRRAAANRADVVALRLRPRHARAGRARRDAAGGGGARGRRPHRARRRALGARFTRRSRSRPRALALEARRDPAVRAIAPTRRPRGRCSKATSAIATSASRSPQSSPTSASKCRSFMRRRRADRCAAPRGWP